MLIILRCRERIVFRAGWQSRCRANLDVHTARLATQYTGHPQESGVAK